MTPRLLRRLACVLTACVVVGAAPALTTPAAANAAAVQAASRTMLTQHIRVSWSGVKRKTSATASVPGIGTLRAICASNSTMIELAVNNRNAETQMWMAKYEKKDGQQVVAVKTVRIYRYANANDDGTGGTGRKGHEGLNQNAQIEDQESGYMHGVISQRPARNQLVANAPLAPVTSFEANWYWSGFRGPASGKSCTIDITLRTPRTYTMALNWHGDADAQVADSRTVPVSGLGSLTLSCDPDPKGDPSVTLHTSGGRSVWLYAETITGEGDEGDHIDTAEIPTDPVTHQAGPIDLPSNGMLRLFFTSGSTTRNFIVSSYYVTNNAENPELNLCEVAAASF
jgi:hypothetical protein